MNSSDLVRIRTFLTGVLAEHDDHAGFDDAESLVQSGRLDSLAVVKLVSFLEADFGVDFTRIEFDPQRFDSMREIAALIEDARA
ncbi:MAG: acyl carrier protein [Burkholderiales bacterium]|nr:acyl carrier protein [Burkholderiales bacterium]